MSNTTNTDEGLTSEELDELQELERFPLDPRDLGCCGGKFSYEYDMERFGRDCANLKLIRSESGKNRATRKHLQRARLHRQQLKRMRMFSPKYVPHVAIAIAVAVSYYALASTWM